MLVFTAIAVAGFLFVAGSFLFGHDHDAGHEHDMGHDAHDGGDEPTISVFSTKVLATLLMGFGAAGAISKQYGLDYLSSSLVGLVTAIALGAVMYAILSVFLKQQASSLVATNSTVGCTGTVTVSIDANTSGEVGLNVEGHYATYVARSKDGSAIPKGLVVRVVKTVGSQLVVEKER